MTAPLAYLTRLSLPILQTYPCHPAISKVNKPTWPRPSRRILQTLLLPPTRPSTTFTRNVAVNLQVCMFAATTLQPLPCLQVLLPSLPHRLLDCLLDCLLDRLLDRLLDCLLDRLPTTRPTTRPPTRQTTPYLSYFLQNLQKMQGHLQIKINQPIAGLAL